MDAEIKNSVPLVFAIYGMICAFYLTTPSARKNPKKALGDVANSLAFVFAVFILSVYASDIGRWVAGGLTAGLIGIVLAELLSDTGRGFPKYACIASWAVNSLWLVCAMFRVMFPGGWAGI